MITFQKLQGLAAQQGCVALPVENFNAEISRLSADAEKELAIQRKVNKSRQIETWLKNAAIPPRYHGAKINPANETQKPVYDRLQKYVDNFAKVKERGSNVLLLGTVGSGKTHLACAVANEVIKKGYSALYLTLNEAVLLMTESWKKSGESEIKILRRFCEPDLIILDEIGCQRSSDVSSSIITAIYDALYREQKPVISLSNLTAEQVCKQLSPRVYDRITQGGVVFELNGESVRQTVEF